MNDLTFGILSVVFSLLSFLVSALSARNEKYGIAVGMLILGGLILRYYTGSDFYLHSWDERYHALVAKNMLSHPLIPTLYENPVLPYNYRDWASNHIWVHKQPVPLWTMSASLWAFGINEFAVRIPSILMTSLGVYLMFGIGRYFFSDRVGYLAAFFFAVNGLVIEQSAGRVSTDHIDVSFLFFIQLAVFFTVKFVHQRNPLFNVLAGISIGAAILSKWLPALIVLPIWLLVVWDSNKFSLKSIATHFTVLIATTVLTFLPWQLYIFHAFPEEAAWEASYNYKHITEALSDKGRPWYFFFERIMINYGELIYLPLGWFFWKLFKQPKDMRRLAICIWFMVPILFFTVVKTKMPGYILFTCPALFLVSAEFWFAAIDYRKKLGSKWLLNLVLVLLILIPLRSMIERVQPFDQHDRNPQWSVDLKELNNRRIHNGILFNYQRSIEAMFYTDLVAYQTIPSKEVIIELVSNGYTVIVNDNDRVPTELRSISELTFERIND